MKHLFVLTILLIFLNACDWQTNPDDTNPLTTLSSLLKETEKNLATFVGSNHSFYTAIVTQQISGVNGQMLDIERYDFKPTYFDENWRICYLGILSNLATIIEYSDNHKHYKYRGISRILLANALGLATDVWGDIPYTESFVSGNNSFTPGYDSQESLYNEIFSLLDLGISDLVNHGGEFYPQNDDLFFQGNPQRWIEYANFLKLRHKLHLSKKLGYAGLLSLVDMPMFSNPGQSFSLDYSLFTGFNPRFVFLSNYPGQIKASSYLVESMQQNSDPRLGVYFMRNSGGQFEGSEPGMSNTNASNLSDSLVSFSSKLILGSYTEQMFIKAELYFMLGMTPEAEAAFSNAIESSLIDYNVFNDFWLLNYLEDIEIDLELIIQAKHAALFLQPVVWSDWRRTGYPSLNASAGNFTGGIIPRRFSYPQSEFDLNPNNVPPGILITDRIWWDSF